MPCLSVCFGYRVSVRYIIAQLHATHAVMTLTALVQITTKPSHARQPVNPYIHGHSATMLTERDCAILQWVTRHGVVTAEHIAGRFFSGQSAAYRRLRKLIDLGLIRRDPTHYRHPFVIRVTPAGARVAGIGVGAADLHLADVPHTLALVTLTERLLVGHPGAVLITEREYRAAQLRALRDGTRPRLGRIPDGVLRLPSKNEATRIALELDLTNKRRYALTRIITAYIDAFDPRPDGDGFGAVWWYVNPSAVLRVRTAVEQAHANDVITVMEWRS